MRIWRAYRPIRHAARLSACGRYGSPVGLCAPACRWQAVRAYALFFARLSACGGYGSHVGLCAPACRWQAVRAYALFAWLFLAKYATLFYRAAIANASVGHFSPHTVENADGGLFSPLWNHEGLRSVQFGVRNIYLLSASAVRVISRTCLPV